MIGVSFIPESGVVTVMVYSQKGVPVYLMNGSSEEDEPSVFHLTTPSESDRVWMPADLGFAWFHALAMFKASMIEDEGLGISTTATAIGVFELLRGCGEPLYMTFETDMLRRYESVTRPAYESIYGELSLRDFSSQFICGTLSGRH